MDRDRIRPNELPAAHETWRNRTINLIASENALSPTVRAALQSDLLERRADYSAKQV